MCPFQVSDTMKIAEVLFFLGAHHFYQSTHTLAKVCRPRASSRVLVYMRKVNLWTVERHSLIVNPSSSGDRSAIAVVDRCEFSGLHLPFHCSS